MIKLGEFGAFRKDIEDRLLGITFGGAAIIINFLSDHLFQKEYKKSAIKFKANRDSEAMEARDESD